MNELLRSKKQRASLWSLGSVVVLTRLLASFRPRRHNSPCIVRSKQLHLVHSEEKPVTGLEPPPQVLSRIVVHDHGEIDPVLEVLLDRFDGRDLTFQCQVEDVGAAKRAQSHLVPAPHLAAVDAYALEPGSGKELVPVFSHYERSPHERAEALGWFHGGASIDPGRAPRFAPAVPECARPRRPPAVSPRPSGSGRGA